MTAPLYDRLHKTSIQNMTDQLKRAIKEESFFDIENIISEMLDKNVSILTIYTFYSYAYTKNKNQSAEYVKQILLVDSNLCTEI